MEIWKFSAYRLEFGKLIPIRKTKVEFDFNGNHYIIFVCKYQLKRTRTEREGENYLG